MVAVSKIFDVLSQVFSYNIIYFVLTPLLFEVRKKKEVVKEKESEKLVQQIR